VRLRIALAISALLCAGAAAALATQTVTIDSTVSIASRNGVFHGRVGSSNPACRRDRKVKLWIAYAKRAQVIGRTTTGADGRWKISPDLGGASAYAAVPRRSEGAAGTIYVCAAARSGIAP
jgi:hypothetical protein